VLIGISFFAAPAKFNAPSLSLPVAMDGGRQEFGVPQSDRDRPLRS